MNPFVMSVPNAKVKKSTHAQIQFCKTPYKSTLTNCSPSEASASPSKPVNQTDDCIQPGRQSSATPQCPHSTTTHPPKAAHSSPRRVSHFRARQFGQRCPKFGTLLSGSSGARHPACWRLLLLVVVASFAFACSWRWFCASSCSFSSQGRSVLSAWRMSIAIPALG